MILILRFISYNNTSEVYKIKKNKISDITYFYDIDKNNMAELNVTRSIDENNINKIVDFLNKGLSRLYKENIGKYTKEHIDVLLLGYRRLWIYKQKYGRFTVIYSSDPGSNDERDEKQITISSEVLEKYFAKFKEKSEKSKPVMT